jgi:hypothetical protein
MLSGMVISYISISIEGSFHENNNPESNHSGGLESRKDGMPSTGKLKGSQQWHSLYINIFSRSVYDHRKRAGWTSGSFS